MKIPCLGLEMFTAWRSSMKKRCWISSMHWRARCFCVDIHVAWRLTAPIRQSELYRIFVKSFRTILLLLKFQDEIKSGNPHRRISGRSSSLTFTQVNDIVEVVSWNLSPSLFCRCFRECISCSKGYKGNNDYLQKHLLYVSFKWIGCLEFCTATC